MTITKHDGFAILPKRCAICNRLFWLEFYDVNYKYIFFSMKDIPYCKCKKCVKRR